MCGKCGVRRVIAGVTSSSGPCLTGLRPRRAGCARAGRHFSIYEDNPRRKHGVRQDLSDETCNLTADRSPALAGLGSTEVKFRPDELLWPQGPSLSLRTRQNRRSSILGRCVAGRFAYFAARMRLALALCSPSPRAMPRQRRREAAETTRSPWAVRSSICEYDSGLLAFASHLFLPALLASRRCPHSS